MHRRKAANIMASVITLDPSCTLGSGQVRASTPIGLYKNLIAAYENGNLDFSKGSQHQPRRVQRPLR